MSNHTTLLHTFTYIYTNINNQSTSWLAISYKVFPVNYKLHWSCIILPAEVMNAIYLRGKFLWPYHLVIARVIHRLLSARNSTLAYILTSSILHKGWDVMLMAGVAGALILPAWQLLKEEVTRGNKR